MATVVNFIDTTLQAAATRTVNLPTAQILLTPSAPAFHVAVDGTITPASITFTATLIDLDAPVVFNATGGALSGVVAKSATLAGTAMTGTSAVVIASATINGTTYTAPCTISKLQDAQGGTPGADGAKTGTARLYQWAPSAPAKPTGTSLFDWPTVSNGNYSASDNWSVAVPANPGTPGLRLYVASVGVTAVASAASSTVYYASATVEAWSQNGATGASGAQSGAATVYQWAATIPAGPAGTGSFKWPDGSFGAAPAGWSLAPGAAPSTGMTLWAARVQVTDSAANATTSFSWSAAAIMAIGYAGTNGGPGQQGASYVTAYCASATGNATSAPAATTGKSSLPAANSGGIAGAWSATVPTLAAGQYLYQSDGIYDPSTDKVTWSIPYWSSLKVATLSAITANLGAINAGSINLGGGTFTVDNDGNLVCHSIQILGGSLNINNGRARINADGSAVFRAVSIQDELGNPVLESGRLAQSAAAPGTLNSDMAPSISAAQQAADAANTAIGNMSSDNVLSKGEKSDLILRWAAITGEASGIANQADALGVNRDAFWLAYYTLNNYLPVGWNDTTTDTAIDGPTFRANFADYYSKRESLKNAMTAKAAIASADLTLIGRGCTVTGVSAIKYTTGAAWNADVYSTQQFAGGAFASAKTTGYFYVGFGLNDNPASDSSYESITLWFETTEDGYLLAWINSEQIWQGTYTAGDELYISYDEVVARWYRNGVLVKDRAIYFGENVPLGFDSTFYTPGATIDKIRCGPFQSALWSKTGGAGRPQDNATVGATIGVNLGGQINPGNASTFIASAAIQSAMVADLRTANYSEDGVGNPTAGAKLASAGTALKVASGSFQVGTVTFSDYWFRLLQGIDGSIAAGRVIWRGNNDSSTRGGAPNINCLQVTPTASQVLNSNFQQVYHKFSLTPSSYSAYTDNLDSMQQIHVQLFASSAAASPFSEFKVPCPSRTYDGSTGGVEGTWAWGWRFSGTGAQPGISAQLESNGVYTGYLRVRLANSYGWSSTQDFAPGTAINTALAKTTMSGSGGSTGGGSGGSGGGGGGYCPAPWVKVRLVNGTEVNADSLHNGARVAAVDDNTMTALPNGGVVRDFAVIWALRYQVRLTDGEATEWSHNHRFATVERGWVHVQDLMPGDHIMGIKECIVDTVLATGEGQVVSFRVEGAGTYFAGGMLCHNIKAPQDL